MKLSKLSASVAVAGLFFAAMPVFAAELVGPTPADNGNVVVGATQTHKNLYSAGGNLTVNADISGDLVAAGGMVSVSGKVEQEALISGGNLFISGAIGSHARVIGGNVNISSPVGGDLVVVGGNINITGKASVAGDLIVLGGTVILDAPVAGDVRVIGGSINLNSKIGGKVYVQASKDLTFGSSAEAMGDITYKGPAAAMVVQGAKVGHISFTLVQTKNFGKALAGLMTLAFLVKLLGWLIAAFVIIKLLKGWVLGIVESIKASPWQNLGVGFLAAVATPIAIVILVISFVGYYLAILLGLSFVLLLALTHVVSAMVAGYWIMHKLSKTGEAFPDWQAIVIGIVVWIILGFIPVIGWLVIAIVYLMVLGAGVKKLKQLIKS